MLANILMPSTLVGVFSFLREEEEAELVGNWLQSGGKAVLGTVVRPHSNPQCHFIVFVWGKSIFVQVNAIRHFCVLHLLQLASMSEVLA